MSDFTLTPDEPLDLPTRPVRLVSAGLADTAEVPRSKRPAPPPCYVPCEVCGTQVLHGRTATDARLALDTHLKTYVVTWQNQAPEPHFLESRGYPVHRCTVSQERD